MKLSELSKGDIATIKNINCDTALKNRFYSFGIIKGSKITIEEVTMTKSTIEIKINNTKVAIRLIEASKIEVENEHKQNN
ncbi:iron transporter [Malaciobacter halophilus]|jgi:ferrous iron transport protein A|uniref:Ferrous iron transport protein A n=1 Tax=Malaciobacter marinus TaxID=505249 RepID=A0AB37A0I0_9BACT|nr:MULTISPECIES: FeoA family protein [Malaciobacter]PPK62428.1 ferrous iron transport protein A [Malaciobacter marinus]RYA24743.1 iron transporter [Malaciobacter halophilus]